MLNNHQVTLQIRQKLVALVGDSTGSSKVGSVTFLRQYNLIDFNNMSGIRKMKIS